MRHGITSDQIPFPKTWGRTRRRLTRLAYRSVNHARRRLLGSRPPFHRFDRGVTGHVRPNIIVEERPRVAAMADLIERCRPDARLRHVRDRTYIDWRYRNPLGEYRFVYHEHDGSVDGFLVLATKRREHAPEVELYIADWEGSYDIRAELLEAVLAWGGFEAIAVWARPFGDRIKGLLTDHGFESLETEISITKPQRTVLVRSTRNGDRNATWTLGGRDLLDIGNWDVRMIYSDGF